MRVMTPILYPNLNCVLYCVNFFSGYWLSVVSTALNLMYAALFNSIEVVIFTFYEYQSIVLRIKKIILHFMKSIVFMNVQFYKRLEMGE